MARPQNDDVIARARLVIQRHPQVESFSDVGTKRGAEIIDIVFKVNLPSEWRSAGKSPSGIFARETVRYAFPANYPIDPPRISLREDFDRRRPHIQPFLIDGRPAPCLSDQPLIDLLHQQGLAGLLNQTAVWLDRAAIDNLIDPAQGWEPMLRNSLADVITADANALRGVVRRTEGSLYLPFDYIAFDDEGNRIVSGSIGRASVKFNRENVPKQFAPIAAASVAAGRSVALVVWPGKNPSGALVVSDEYTPEDVTDIGGLLRRAKTAGCETVLASQINWIASCLSGRGYNGAPISIAIVLCIRRPFHLIGTDSDIELCPYVFEVMPAVTVRIPNSTSVRPAAHNDLITGPLLQRMSSDQESSARVEWTLIGCGSIGSKVAIHLARSGRAPSRAIDNRAMRPHNAARHALIPTEKHREVLWARNKAALLKEAVSGFDQETVVIPQDAARILQSPESCRQAWPASTWAIVNTTGSIRLREALANAPRDRLAKRVIELALFAKGTLGWMTIEGPDRNPSTGDLAAEAYAIAASTPALRALLQSGNDELTVRSIGEGCGSTTMVMSDGRLSMFGAGMAETILQRQIKGLSSTTGEIVMGSIQADGISLDWIFRHLDPLVVVRAENSKIWRIHVHSRAEAAIRNEITLWPDVETGGILVGRVSEISRTFNITDVLPAPPDSIRSASEFILGTQGVRQMLEGLGRGAGGTLYCLGTWHSHLHDSGPSGTDKQTAASIALSRLMPSLLLIATPNGYRALIADPSTHGAPKGLAT